MAVNGRRRLMINMDSNLMDRVATKNSDEWNLIMDEERKMGPGISGYKSIIPPHQSNEQARAKYIEKYNASEGFDVDEVKGFIGFVYPINLTEQPGLLNDANTLSQMAIHLYNKEHGTSYRFINVLKLNTQAVSGFIHYVTFVAFDENKVPCVGETFQALGYKRVSNELTVEYCRVKAT